MKKEKNLRIFLYVVTILSLIYTCYTVFQAYGTFTSYYQGIAYQFLDVFAYVISSCYAPLCFTILFYVMIVALDIWCDYLEKEVAGGVLHVEANEDPTKEIKKAAKEQYKDDKDLAKGAAKIDKAVVKEEKESIDEMARSQKEAAKELAKENRAELNKIAEDEKKFAAEDKRIKDKEIDETKKEAIKDAKEAEDLVKETAKQVKKNAKK
ncbi:hypothetical protein C815_01438 [Firmicutes bacterium M10-2]|nr:hypothetical protein C815_01438 [Firmicutes bacterium M10-2]